MQSLSAIDRLVEPLDAANQALLRAVHPPEWQNPEPHDVYDLVVLGGGTAGLVSAVGAAGLGARVALVERALLGGDCLNTGCVPSKALIRSARAIADARRAARLGVRVGSVEPDFAAIMGRMRERRACISANDSAQRLQRAGVDVFLGSGAFTSGRTLDVAGLTLKFNRAVIATGARPVAPPVPGLDGVPFLTNETVFGLTDLPPRLAVIGVGPIGCELAQAFARFGSEVTLLGRELHVLPNEDADAAAIVQRQLLDDGVRLELGVELIDARRDQAGVRIRYERRGMTAAGEVTADHVLLAAGRAPNVEGLGLDQAGVRVSAAGVVVNDRMQTSSRRIYAAGDVCSRHKFTHAADAQARIVIQNALFYGRKRASRLVVPWCTYTDPEIAHVGMYEAEARQQGLDVKTITIHLADVDRALLDDEAEGFVRVHHVAGRLVGCTIVAAHAGELIGEATYVVTHGGTLADLAATIHPYPTQAEALKKAGDAYRRESLTPSVKRWFERYFRWTR
ncbi:MAG: mercuric reductase [Vicinamibacterales bacterium]